MDGETSENKVPAFEEPKDGAWTAQERRGMIYWEWELAWTNLLDSNINSLHLWFEVLRTI